MNPLRTAASALLCTFALVSQQAAAVEYRLPAANSRLIGENQEYVVPADNRPLEQIAADFQLGLTNIMEANPGVDPYLPKAGSTLIIPHQLILPNAPREGIVINVAEMRLYYYPKGKNVVEVLPIGIGQLGVNTPENWITKVERKRANPTWTPTENIRRRYAAQGKTLPAVWPAGPDNPMGLHALYIGNLYAIHGTNATFGIGLRVSSGCVRLRADDIKYLFDNVPVGTR
ncbi:L,D-transpeptidase family protein, partial [Aeromonas sp. CPF2-S1]|nr:L,D-transpeptidase family protein [Aeromonas sp. CPF2-S1]